MLVSILVCTLTSCCFQYFKRRRQNVEIIASLGGGLGLTIFSKLIYELI